MKSQEFLKYFNAAAKIACKTDERPILQSVYIKSNQYGTCMQAADGFHAVHMDLPVNSFDIMLGKGYSVAPNRRTSKGHLVQAKPDKHDNSDVTFTASTGTINTCTAGKEVFTVTMCNYWPDFSLICPNTKKAKKFTLSLSDLADIVQSGRESAEINKDDTCDKPAVFSFDGIRVGYNPAMIEKGIEFMRLFDVVQVDLYLQVQSSCAILPSGGNFLVDPTYIFMPMHLE